MKPDKIGVHTTHCCTRHGCKYGDKDCPVVTGQVKQEYLCEECGDVPLLRDQEYVYLRCTRCGERIKLGRNAGGGWWGGFPGMTDFLLEHSGCGTQDIKLEWE